MTPDDIDYVALSLSPLFVGLNQDELRDLVDGAEIHVLKGSQTVVTEGEPGTRWRSVDREGDRCGRSRRVDAAP